MAATCPKCSNPVEGDFGLVTCPHCGTVLSLDFDGNASMSDVPSQLSQSVDLSTIDNNEPEGYEPVTIPVEPLISIPSPIEEVSHTPDVHDFAHTPAEPSDMNFDSETEIPSDLRSAPEFIELDPLESDRTVAASDNNNEETFVGSTKTESAQSVPQDPRLSAAVFDDVVDFGNSTKQEGPLTYTVVIGKIDTAAIRNKVIQAMSDPSLHIDLNAVLATFSQGEMHIQNLGPAKTNRLVKKLQSLPISVRWRQNAYQ